MIMRNFQVVLLLVCIAVVAASTSPREAAAATGPHLSKGQTLYVPVYSNIFTAPKEIPIHLANIVAIRNTDMHNQIQVTAADYYDTRGNLVKRYYQKPVVLAPLETIYLYLSERDQEGGFGANFIIRWQATREVNAPLIECLMVGNQGRAFVSPGLIIAETTK
jgi:hypothetical protein